MHFLNILQAFFKNICTLSIKWDTQKKNETILIKPQVQKSILKIIEESFVDREMDRNMKKIKRNALKR